jgi:fibronectin type 3 domain-containing protein
MLSVALLGSCGGGGGSSGQSAAAGGKSSVTLAWDPVAAPNVAGYRVYYGTSTGIYSQPQGSGLEAGTATTFTAMGLNGGTRYYFAATAYDNTGNESDYSNEVFKDIP